MTTFMRMETLARGRDRRVAHSYSEGRALYARKHIRRPGHWAPARAAPRYLGGHDK
ncbi:MAG: hypothetical protein WC005_03355 [Candidatus Nanopelagicales bacterium]